MAYKTSDGITVLEGLVAVRRRPALYIGGEDEHPSPRARMLELAVTDIALERRPQEVRILLWREGVIMIVYDGRPLPIEPSARAVDDIPYPALYRSFMYLGSRPSWPARRNFGSPIAATNWSATQWAAL